MNLEQRAQMRAGEIASYQPLDGENQLLSVGDVVYFASRNTVGKGIIRKIAHPSYQSYGILASKLTIERTSTLHYPWQKKTVTINNPRDVLKV